MITKEEFEDMWERTLKKQDQEQREFEALSKEEKKRRLGKYDPAFLERISGGMGLCESDE